MDFFLLLCTTAVLLIRPADYFASSVNLYLVVILACLVATLRSGSLARVLELCSPRSLRRSPVSGCVLGLMGITVLSDLGNLRPDALLGTGLEFGKVVIFFLLLVGLADSRRRLRVLLFATPLFIGVTVLLSVLQFLGYIDSPAFHKYRPTGELAVMDRMIGPGSYQDPNDLCTLINVAAMLSLYGLLTTRPRILGVAWLALLGLLGYALHLTQSRGGLLGTLTGIAVLFWARFGLRKGVIALAVALPVLLSFFGGRQVDLSSRADTAQLRIQLWMDALMAWKQSPISLALGVGSGCLPEIMERPPHNSFLAAYAELGFFGGTLFLGAFLLGFQQLYRLRPRPGAGPAGARPGPRPGPASGGPPGRGVGGDPELERMRPFLMGAMASYALNIASTNHTFTVATYEVLGIVAAYIRIATSGSPGAGTDRLVLDGRTFARLCLVSVGFVILLTIYVRLKVQW